MRPPHDHGAFDRKAPEDYPSVGVSGEQTEVLAQEVQCVCLSTVATEDVGGLCWRLGLRDSLHGQQVITSTSEVAS